MVKNGIGYSWDWVRRDGGEGKWRFFVGVREGDWCDGGGLWCCHFGDAE